MKKLLFLIVLFGVLTSCQLTNEPNVNKIERNLVYFKDEKTGLCFAAINSMSSKSLSNSTSITCVPCDSLKKVKVKVLK